MMQRSFELIAFDGDDTLWHNERSYREGRDRLRRLLAAAGVDLSAEELETRVNTIEFANLQYFGYGVSSFTLSIIEAAIVLTSGRIAAADVGQLVAMAKRMMAEEIELFASARDTVAALSAVYPLMLITKGDLLHQTSKLDRSGLRRYFSFVEVVSHKTTDVYASILNRHGIDPDGFLMIGNSLRSDILPVIEVGAWAIHVPAALSWAHEDADEPDGSLDRYAQLPALGDVCDFVETFARSARAR
ncbi:MAG TPA: HAD family hydrolase [Vicinamibacterales bacterium]